MVSMIGAARAVPTTPTVYKCTAIKAIFIIGVPQQFRMSSTLWIDVIESNHWLKISLHVCTSKFSLVLYVTDT
jgi:hypothetical protein